MKTPVEIKKGLLICGGGFGDCAECPYHQTPAACMKLSQDALAYIQQLERRICELTENVAQLGEVQPKWISVDERMPEREVLAANFAPRTYGYKEYIIGYVSEEKCTEPGKCFATNDYEILYNVTHWMPLPEPPKEEHHD